MFISSMTHQNALTTFQEVMSILGRQEWSDTAGMRVVSKDCTLTDPFAKLLLIVDADLHN